MARFGKIPKPRIWRASLVSSEFHCAHHDHHCHHICDPPCLFAFSVHHDRHSVAHTTLHQPASGVFLTVFGECHLIWRFTSPSATMASVSGNSGSGGSAGGMPKKPDKREYRKGQKLKKYTLDDKQKVIDLIEQGYKTCDIVKLLNVPESTIRNIRKSNTQVRRLTVTTRWPSNSPS